MRDSYEGIGQWAATFACEGNVAEGQMVKVGGNGAVTSCADGERFAGQAAAVGRDGRACGVTLGGMVTAAYTGSAPALGWSGLSANGSGGVQADGSGWAYLVVDVDTAAMAVTFVL